MRKLKILSVVWHSVLPDTINPAYLTEWDPTVSLFRKQIQFLVDRYTPISVREFVKLTEDPSQLKSYERPPILLTFDDGFKNVVDNALPVLNEFGIPGLFFVIGEVIKNPEFIPWYVQRTYLFRRTSKQNVVHGGTSFDLSSPAGRRSLTLSFAAALNAC